MKTLSILGAKNIGISIRWEQNEVELSEDGTPGSYRDLGNELWPLLGMELLEHPTAPFSYVQ